MPMSAIYSLSAAAGSHFPTVSLSANYVGQSCPMTTTDFSLIVDPLQDITRQSPDIMPKLLNVIHNLSTELSPYCADPLCPELLLKLNHTIQNIQQLAQNPSSCQNMTEYLRNQGFNYFFKPLKTPMQVRGVTCRPSLFLADIFTLVNAIDEQKQKCIIQKETSQLSGTLQQKEIAVNGNVITLMNDYSAEINDYEPIIPFEGPMTQKIMITDPVSTTTNAVIISAPTFQGIMKSSIKKHPITRNPMSDCQVAMLIPYASRNYVGIPFSIDLFNHINQMELQALFETNAMIVNNSIFVDIDIKPSAPPSATESLSENAAQDLDQIDLIFED